MKLYRWLAAIALSTGSSLLSWPAAQATPIVPQAGSPTQVQQTGDEFTITGGVSSADGQALFHAFEQLGLSQGQIATFLAQPNVQAILGSVTGGDASYIDGLLQVVNSAADLYLINPSGILFGPNAQLDLAGSLAATTASGVLFDDAVFNVLSGDDFSQVSGLPTGFVFAMDEAGAVVNAADLRVGTGESITLIGGQVISTGTLTAPAGAVTIAAIPEAGIVRISHPDLVLNLEVETLPAGAIAAGNTFTPLSLPTLLTGAPAGLATEVSVQADGTIALTSSDRPIAAIAGTAIAAGGLDTAGVRGGDLTLVGDRVALLNASVNASGETGGGTVRIGGDLQGQPTLPGSALTYVDAASTLTANAGSTGNGGSVILWSDGTTAFYGQIAADGGTSSGDGGFVEVSGAETLIYEGTVSAIAPNGQVGTLLLDPTDITIRNGTNDGDDSDGSPLLLTEFNIAAADPIPTILYESELENSPGNIDLAIRASNNITIADLADNALTFQTDGVAPGSITFEAGGAFQMLDLNDAIQAPQRALTINANTITAGELDTSAGLDQGGDVVLNATGAIAIGDVLTSGDPFAGSGNITITGSSLTAGQISADGGFSNTSRVELTTTSGDLLVDTIAAGSGGLAVDAAQRFQVRDTFPTGVRITLDSSTDGELINFLMRGDPQPLIDAGLVDPANPNDQVFITFPTSIFVSPDGGPGEIVIRHGGQANTFTADGILIEGTGALPDQQFVVGPNDDHTIDIDPSIPTANFTGFTTLYPPGMFPANVNGVTGAILRGQGDATLVTSFQNQPFVPVVTPPEVTSPATPTAPTTPMGGGGIRGPEGMGGGASVTNPIAGETTNLENLSDDETASVVEAIDAADSSDSLSTPVDAEECEAAIANRSANRVEITSTCEEPSSPNSSESVPLPTD